MNIQTVFIIDDDQEICHALSMLLETVHLPAKIFTHAQNFLDNYNSSWQGCLLIDVRMPDMSGLTLQQHLLAKHNTIPIIMMSGHADVPTAVRAMQAGAKDFILKPFSDHELLEKIQAIISQAEKRSTTLNLAVIAEHHAKLTQREQEVMRHVIAGKLNKQIAAELGISMSTVELHRSHIMHKMEAKNLAELIKMFLLLDKII